MLGASPKTAHRVVDSQPAAHGAFQYRLHKHEYLTALRHAGFCGGSRPFAHAWLTRDDLLKALTHLGLGRIEIAFDDPGHANGPALSLVARR
ncbi:MAG: hypothetical protein R2712_18805 [Vicinamibacterales bacterium]